MIIRFEDKRPKVEKAIYIAENATLIGDVRLGEYVSIWPGAVLRADISYIEIDNYSNIQDNSIVHLDFDKPTIVGKYVTVGHGVTLHGCKVEDGVLVGMGAIILNGAEIGKESIIAAGTVIPPGKIIPPRSLVMGVPGKVVREVTEEEIEHTYKNAKMYAELAGRYKGQ